jgi:hypothetical protein
MSFQPEELTGGAQASWGFQMAGRLKPGVTPALAREDADRVARETMRSYPAFMAGLRITSVVHDLHEDTIAKARPLVRTLFLAVAVVLLIACANLAGLLLVRAIRRRPRLQRRDPPPPGAARESRPQRHWRRNRAGRRRHRSPRWHESSARDPSPHREHRP